jgi:Domain of unknown function (DUF4177)
MKWEYAVEDVTGRMVLVRKLNELGDQGWEVIAVLTTSTPDGVTQYEVILKRDKGEPPTD